MAAPSDLSVGSAHSFVYVNKFSKGSSGGDELVLNRALQVKQGVKRIRRRLEAPLIILSEDWPSMAIDMVNVMEEPTIRVFCKGLEEKWKSRLSTQFTWIALGDIPQLLLVPSVKVIVQGSRSFVEEMLAMQSMMDASSGVICVLPAVRLRGSPLLLRNFSWLRLQHSDIGGVSDSRWQIGYVGMRLELESLSITTNIQRRLKDVLKYGHRGKLVHPNTMEPSVLLQDRDSLIKLHMARYQEVITCCHMVSSGWVERRLTPNELAAVVDVPELLYTSFQLPDFEVEPLSILPFLSAAPGKVAQIVSTLSLVLWGKDFNHPCQKPCSRRQQKDIHPLIADPSSLHTVKSRTVTQDYLKQYGASAAKDDNAVIPVELWNSVLMQSKHFGHISFCPELHGKKLEVLRESFAHRIYYQNVIKSFNKHLIRTYGNDWIQTLKNQPSKKRKRNAGSTSPIRDELVMDLRVGLDGIYRAVKSSWWSWDAGSTLFFWRWPEFIRREARDGVKVFIEGSLPTTKSRMVIKKDPKIPDLLAKMWAKLQKVIERGYIAPGFVMSLVNYFAVPKGLTDIRMVYDGTKSKLNAAVWAPNFFLPSVDSVLCFCDASTWFADLDLGEMFLNYFMDQAIRAYSGVDVTQLSGAERARWMIWLRTFMGFKSSPFNAAKLFGITMDVIRGNQFEAQNPYRWTRVRRNYPGMSTYNPALGWAVKMFIDTVAGDLEAYVDDVRPFGPTENICLAVTRRAAQLLQYLGQQDACRKYRPPSKVPGPWCGAFMATRDNSLWVYVSQEKWDKAKRLVSELLLDLTSHREWTSPNGATVSSPVGFLVFKPLEKARGFLVYLCRTYRSITPYLKGLHLSLDSWRALRGPDGWKLSVREQKDVFKAKGGMELTKVCHPEETPSDIPKEVSCDSIAQSRSRPGSTPCNISKPSKTPSAVPNPSGVPRGIPKPSPWPSIIHNPSTIPSGSPSQMNDTNTPISSFQEYEEDDMELILDREGDLIVSVEDSSVQSAPSTVKGVQRLLADLQVLESFFKATTPPWRFVRGKIVFEVRYGFGDASKSGFGASLEQDGDVWYRLGIWGKDSEEDSSNYRELNNLVSAMEEKASEGDLGGAEVFFFTDNTTAEGAFYKGTSKNKKLFELVRRLREVELAAGCVIHIIHVAGTRMISQGTDGLSRGDTAEGVMKGDAMLAFVPLHLSAVERSATLKPWLLDIFDKAGSEMPLFIEEEGWFSRAHDIIGGNKNDDGVWIPEYHSGTYIWTPPPAGGQVAIEQLRRARNKRQSSTHVFVIPRLFTSIWRKQLHKAADLIVELPSIPNVWELGTHHEPLILAFIFPFLSCRPWQLKRTGAFLGLGRLLRRMWKEEDQPIRPLLCQLLKSTRRLASLSDGMVRQVLSSTGSFGFLYTPSRERGRGDLEKKEAGRKEVQAGH